MSAALATARRLVRKVLKRGKKGRRRLKEGLTVPEFFRQLADLDCRYVVLRWFESLPVIHVGEDLDILVADEDVTKIEQFLTTEPRASGVPCDLYSASGQPGTSYRALPYYPPWVAKEILSRAVTHASGAKVPCAEDYFWSLAFHALYHKGLASGLPPGPGLPSVATNPEHDYLQELSRLAQAAGLELNLDMRSLDTAFERRHWRPPPDMLVKLGTKNSWCADRAEEMVSKWPHIPGLAAFIIREVARDDASVNKIKRILEEDGFHLLRVQRLEGDVQRQVHEQVRGGTWSRGPWPRSAGGPAWTVVALDEFPIHPSPPLQKLHPHADNERVFIAKERVRKTWNKQLAKDEHTNVLHSSDEARHAAHYAQLAMPHEAEQVFEEARAHLQSMEVFDDEIVRELSAHGRRARVLLIRSKSGELAVRKVYRLSQLRFLEREIEVMQRLHELDREGVIPPVTGRTRTSFLMPYYANTSTQPEEKTEPLPLWAIRKAFAAVRAFHEHGYEFLDFSPQNMIVGPDWLKLIDFEFVFHIAEGERVAFEQSQTIHGPAVSWQRDRPVANTQDWYRSQWFPVTGLPLDSLLHDEEWLQQIKRQWHLARLGARTTVQQGRRRLLKAAKILSR
jgi:hypothetical protein